MRHERDSDELSSEPIAKSSVILGTKRRSCLHVCVSKVLKLFFRHRWIERTHMVNNSLPHVFKCGSWEWLEGVYLALELCKCARSCFQCSLDELMLRRVSARFWLRR